MLYDENSYYFEAGLIPSEDLERDIKSKLSENILRKIRVTAKCGKTEVGSLDLCEVEPNRFLIRNFTSSENFPDVKKALFRFIGQFSGTELVKKGEEKL